MSQNLTKFQVQKLANLAKLEFSDSELTKFQTQLSSILDFVSQLQEVDTKGIQPTFQVTGLTDILREDEVHPWTTREELLQTSQLPIKNDMIEVPSVFEK